MHLVAASPLHGICQSRCELQTVELFMGGCTFFNRRCPIWMQQHVYSRRPFCCAWQEDWTLRL